MPGIVWGRYRERYLSVVGGRDQPGAASAAAGRSVVAPAGTPFAHAAAVVDSRAEALAATLPFLQQGLSAGDLVVLSCPPERADLLSRELGERAAGVERDSRLSLLDTRAPDALVAARKLLERAARTRSGRLRVLGETQFGVDPQSRQEGQRYEAVVNVLLAADPIDALCLYDRRVLPPDVVASAEVTHPSLVVSGAAQPSTAYRPPADYVADLPIVHADVEDGDPVFALAAAASLPTLRHRLAAALATVVADRDQRDDLHLAVSEIAANAFRHGGPPVSANLWADGDRLVCTIHDCGTGYGDVLAGFQPAHGADLSLGGMGLWLARKLWDHVDLMPGPDGFTVRLSTVLR
jgi:anti-sigma regulatory factor (Ser/Thr protein kinase)